MHTSKEPDCERAIGDFVEFAFSLIIYSAGVALLSRNLPIFWKFSHVSFGLAELESYGLVVLGGVLFAAGVGKFLVLADQLGESAKILMNGLKITLKEVDQAACKHERWLIYLSTAIVGITLLTSTAFIWDSNPLGFLLAACAFPLFNHIMKLRACNRPSINSHGHL